MTTLALGAGAGHPASARRPQTSDQMNRRHAINTQTDLERAPFGALLAGLAEEHPETVVLAADLARYVDVLTFAERFPDRFLQMGMSEQNAVGVAAGLAKAGLTPIFVTYGVFISRRAFDQVAMSLATSTNTVVLVGVMPGITTPFRATHQAIDDVSLMRGLPGMTVIDPADAEDLGLALHEAVGRAGPTYIRAFRGTQEPLARPDGPPQTLATPALLADGDGPAFISTGLASQWVSETRAAFPEQAASIAHLHVPTLKPLDESTILDFCAGRSRVICVENHTIRGGLFESVAGVVARAGTGIRLEAVGVPDVWPPSGSLPYLRDQLGLSAASLAARAFEGGER